jgi:hypothetical protein
MTAREYDEYVASFNAGMDREGIGELSAKMDENDEAVETYFSWRPCEICHRNLGGDRQDCIAYHEESGDIVEFSVCIDCYYFAECGKLDDTTMMEVEKDREQNPAPMQEE